jgi:hypothetical protein
MLPSKLMHLHKWQEIPRKEHPMSHKQKLNNQEAAAWLGIQPNTLEIWRCKHKGPRYSKIGRRVIYDLKDLEEFFASRSIDTLESTTLDRRYRNQK